MNKEEIVQIQSLICKVNKITAYHRHGNKIPKKVLDDLSNFQIDFEKWLASATTKKSYDHEEFLAKLPISIKKSFLEYATDPETNERIKLRLQQNAILFEGPEISFTLYDVKEFEKVITTFTSEINDHKGSTNE